MAIDQAENLRQMVEKRREVRVISVASGKGGVGKSSISVNLAIIMRRLGKRVLILDADFGLANIDVMLGITTRLDLRYFLKGEKTIDEIIQTGHEGVRFISGGSGVTELINMSDEQLNHLLSTIVNTAAGSSPENQIDVIIMDAGAGVSNTIMQILLASSETIIVTTPEPTAFLDAYALVKTIIKQDATHPLHLIANKCEKIREAQSVLTGLIDTCGKHLGKNINPLGLVSYNHDITTSIKSQLPLVISDPYGQTTREITTIARAVLNMPIEEREQKGVIARVFTRVLGARA